MDCKAGCVAAKKNKAGDASRALQGVGTLGSTDVTAPSFGNRSFGHHRHEEAGPCRLFLSSHGVFGSPKMLGKGGRT